MKAFVLSVLFFFLISSGCSRHHDFSGIELSAPHPAPAIVFDSARGPINTGDLTGKYTYLYFGFTYCPDVCPATLFTLAQVIKELGEKAEKVRVVMVTVDPERDTPEQLGRYMNYFGSSFIGLTGDKRSIDAFGEPFGLYYEKHPGSIATGYLINHSSTFFLLDPKGNAILAYRHGTPVSQLQEDITYILERK